MEEVGGDVECSPFVAEKIGGGPANVRFPGRDVDAQRRVEVGLPPSPKGVDVFLLGREVIDGVHGRPRLRLALVAKAPGQRQVFRDHVGQQREEQVLERFHLAAEANRLGEGHVSDDLEVFGRDPPAALDRAPLRIGLRGREPAHVVHVRHPPRRELSKLEVRDPRGIDPAVRRVQHLALLELVDGERGGPAPFVRDVAEQSPGLGVVGVADEHRAETRVGHGVMFDLPPEPPLGELLERLGGPALNRRKLVVRAGQRDVG